MSEFGRGEGRDKTVKVSGENVAANREWHYNVLEWEQRWSAVRK